LKRFDPHVRIQIYMPIHNFLNLLSEEMENEIEEGKYEQIILDSPTSRNNKKIIKELPDPVERLAVISLTAKYMADTRKTDDRNILFSLSRIPIFLFPNFSTENVKLYSQAEVEEIIEFLNEFNKNLPQHSPRFDTKLLLVLKIEFYVNIFLYFAKSMSEKRFPFGSDFYEFISFIIHEFYTLLKPLIDEIPKETKNMISIFNQHLNYTTIIYLLEHYPEQATELIFILNNIDKLSLTENEKKLLSEILEESILVNREEKAFFIQKLNK